uniref:THH1/TOM1/TOM3 domain-containing protein n=1 Tax=Paramoeba aestuarina TaxID=180227 RepID=A0A7S4KH01_9EUKA|mmetsp:Transcript_18997/g.29797  ORF Transcript_18997/g.29797 Transcript_18997/m.29797 type:complete len:243 (+) Transcript_18997:72-800(+)
MICFLSLCMMTMRSVYVGLYASEDLQDVSLKSIVMVELPCFLYASLFSVLFMSLSYAYANITSDETTKVAARKVYWMKWGVFQVFLMVFFAVIVALMELLPDESTTEVSCLGQTATNIDDDTISVIRFYYHLVLSILSFGCVIGLSILAKKIFERTKSKDLIKLCLVINTGLFANSVAWVIYSGIDSVTPYFVIPLFLTEGVFVVTTVMFLCPHDLKRLYYMKKSEISSGSLAQFSAKSEDT